ncbi:MAG: glycosyltransferase family A protein [Paraglaciecola polaris]|uniref:glycosyltransferase family A protein n=1 Tax=Paraglaciecola polaris TaxID=222814 RepID=UPI00300356B6
MTAELPSVAILLPVFNGESFIEESLDSLINQTYKNVSIVIVDDCSSDNTVEIIQHYINLNYRIELHQNASNLGIIESRNLLLELSSAKYLAFMDADDVCLPNRIEAQVEFLEQHSGIDALSCWYSRFGYFEDTICTPVDSDEIATALFLDNVMCNPAMMVRNDFFKKHHLKCDAKFRGAADYKLWVDCSKKGRLACLPQMLFRYRTHGTQESQKNNQRQKNAHYAIVEQQFSRLGLTVNVQHISSLIWPNECEKSELYTLGKWLKTTSENPDITDKILASRVFSFIDIRFRSCCVRYGIEGLIAYIKCRGIVNLMQGRNFGFSFVKRCIFYR